MKDKIELRSADEIARANAADDVAFMIDQSHNIEGKIDAMLELLRPFDLKEVVRTGQIAMARRGELKAPKKCGGKTGNIILIGKIQHCFDCGRG